MCRIYVFFINILGNIAENGCPQKKTLILVFLFLSLRNEYSCRGHCGQTHGNEGVWSVPDNRHVLPQLRHCQPHDTRRGSRHRPEESQRLEGHSSASFKEHVTRIATKELISQGV